MDPATYIHNQAWCNSLRYNITCVPDGFTLSAPTPVPTHPSANNEYLQPEGHLARCHTPAIINGFESVDAGSVSRWHRYRAHLQEPIP